MRLHLLPHRPLMQCLNRLQRRIGFAVVQATAPALDNASEPAQILVLPLQIKQPRPQFIQLLPGF